MLRLFRSFSTGISYGSGIFNAVELQVAVKNSRSYFEQSSQENSWKTFQLNFSCCVFILEDFMPVLFNQKGLESGFYLTSLHYYICSQWIAICFQKKAKLMYKRENLFLFMFWWKMNLFCIVECKCCRKLQVRLNILLLFSWIFNFFSLCISIEKIPTLICWMDVGFFCIKT